MCIRWVFLSCPELHWSCFSDLGLSENLNKLPFVNQSSQCYPEERWPCDPSIYIRAFLFAGAAFGPTWQLFVTNGYFWALKQVFWRHPVHTYSNSQVIKCDVVPETTIWLLVKNQLVSNTLTFKCAIVQVFGGRFKSELFGKWLLARSASNQSWPPTMNDE